MIVCSALFDLSDYPLHLDFFTCGGSIRCSGQLRPLQVGCPTSIHLVVNTFGTFHSWWNCSHLLVNSLKQHIMWCKASFSQIISSFKPGRYLVSKINLFYTLKLWKVQFFCHQMYTGGLLSVTIVQNDIFLSPPSQDWASSASYSHMVGRQQGVDCRPLACVIAVRVLRQAQSQY